MKKLILGLLFASLCTLPAHAASNIGADNGLITVESQHSVKDTLDRLTKIMTSKGITIFARVDHGAGAKKVGKELAPTELLIFGNPKLGSPLMQSKQSIGIDLPLKALAWQDKAGKVWVSYNNPAYLKARHGVTDKDPIFKKMTGVLGKLIGKAVTK